MLRRRRWLIHRWLDSEGALRCSYRWMIGTQSGRAELGDLSVAALRFVDVAEFAGHAGQVEGEGQHDGVLVAEPVVPGGQRLLKQPPSFGEVAQSDDDLGEEAGGGQYVRIVNAEHRGRGVDSLIEQRVCGAEIALGGQGTRALHSGGEV
jgi:hypothetical protein